MNKVKMKSKLICSVLIVLCILQIGCSARNKDETNVPLPVELSRSTVENSAEEIKLISSVLEDYRENIAYSKEQNDHTIGWLDIPTLDINDVVLVHPENNVFYWRRNFERKKEFSGVFYADYRSVFGNGTKDELGINTCIYGHALTDNPDDEKYYEKFGPLHDLRSEDVAKSVPYIFFSTEEENMAFEIFAVFIANTHNDKLPYNRNDIEPPEFYKMVKEEVLPRSLYNYNVDLKESDKFLTLSTCIYVLPDGTSAEYFESGVYRYAVMARLADPGEPLKEKANITVNKDPIIDPKIM